MSAPQRFRKKPVVVEAMLFAAYTEGCAPAVWNDYEGGRLWRWLSEGGCTFTLDQVDPGPAFLKIGTLEGVMRADVGDWIIRGVAGEFYPCKPNIFAATYEPADGSTPSPSPVESEGERWIDRAEDWFHLWAKVHGIQQEAKPYAFGTPQQHITLDHIHEEATTALDLIESLRGTDRTPTVSVPLPEWEALRHAVRTAQDLSRIGDLVHEWEVVYAAVDLVASADRVIARSSAEDGPR